MINNISQIMIVVLNGAIDANNNNSHGQYLVGFASIPYNLPGNKYVGGQLL